MNGHHHNKDPKRTRVVVAMSGGVDSATTAAMLVEQGHDVVGITLQLYDHGEATARPGSCCAGQDIHDARRVADRLGIPHYVLDYERRFRDQVIDPFAASYAAGETPIPCVLCNQTVKFTDLLGTVGDLDADIMATGHYVRRKDGPDGPALWTGVEPERDQSYFLFATTRDQLARLWFPLGSSTKSETRTIAARLGLPVAEKADSQDICFVHQRSYADVVERLRPEAAEAGDIVDLGGRVLGHHQGIARFTIGQRRGLKIASDQPLYVVRLDAKARRVVVGPREALRRERLTLRDVNWLGRGEDVPADGVRVMVKLRSTQPPVPAIVSGRDAARAEVVLDPPQDAVAPGQACVFYDNDRVLGGGWITRETGAA